MLGYSETNINPRPSHSKWMMMTERQEGQSSWSDFFRTTQLNQSKQERHQVQAILHEKFLHSTWLLPKPRAIVHGDSIRGGTMYIWVHLFLYESSIGTIIPSLQQ